MKNYLRKIFRYPAVDAYMLFACFIAFIALFIALSLVDKAWNYEADQKKYQYASTYTGELLKDEVNENINVLALTEGIECNVSLDGFQISLKGEKESLSHMSARVYIRHNEEYIFPLSEGHYPEGEDFNSPVCVVGKLYANLFDVKVGDTLQIDGSLYTVCGVLGEKEGDYASGMLFLWYEALTAETKSHIDIFPSLNIVFESNKSTTYDAFLEVGENIKKTHGDSRFFGVSGYADENMGQGDLRVIFYYVLYAFALLHCVVASDIWAYERKYEVAVKKTYGFSSSQIVGDLLLQILRITASAALLCFVVQWILVRFGASLLGIDLTFSLRNLGLIIGFVFLTAVIGIMRPVNSLNSDASVHSMQKGSDGV